jgi:hypothetical protein
MKRFVLLAFLILALPLSAFANPVDFTNLNGSLAGNIDGLGLIGSKLISVTGLGNGHLDNLGSVTFTTGA